MDHLKSECNDFTRDFINKLCDEEILRSEKISVKNMINGTRELANEVRSSLERGEKNILNS